MIKVIDDLIAKSTQERLKSICERNDFKWYIKNDVTYVDLEKIDKKFLDKPSFGLSRTIFENGFVDDETILQMCFSLLDNLEEKTGIQIKEIIRIQFNLQYKHVDKTFTFNNWNSAHVDQKFDHKVILYYVNESDGDTFLFNETISDEFDRLTIKKRVSPKQGRAVLFDGKYYHASSNPISNDKRLAVNINFI